MGQSTVRTALLAVFDLALPAECAGCGQRPGLLCRRCVAALAAPARLAWPQPAPAALPPPWAVAGYDGAVRAAMLAHKERGRSGLAAPLGAALAASVRAAVPSGPVLLVPMPSRRSAVRERGRDATLALARRAAQVLRADRAVSVLPVLRMAASVQDQSGLDATARAANLHRSVLLPGALVHRLRVPGARVVLVDDIITTGASLAAAADTVRRAGIEPVGAAVVAATRRRTPSG